MSGLVGPAEQVVASFVLHALWQAPLLAGAAALAIRVGRPQARTAHALWVATLLLCVLMPVGATITARRAALEAERAAAVTVTFTAVDYPGALPEMQRLPAWQRMVDQHFNLRVGLRPFALQLPTRLARCVACVYLLIAICLGLRLAVAWRRSWRLVGDSFALPEQSVVARALRRQCEAFAMPLPPARVSDAVVGPALAGAFHPTLLLPACAEQMTDAEIEAVLAHELAHLRRHDPPVHFVCSLLLVPVGFHPAVLWVAKRVRQTREMACDAEAAGQMGSASRYARALLQVAERTGAGGEQAAGLGLFQTGLGLFNGGLGLFPNSLELTGGAMEERMQMMMKSNDRSSVAVRVARWSACVAVCGIAVLTAAMLQVRPAFAQQMDAAPQASQTVVIEEGQTPLLGGGHAQETLHKAERDLEVAQTKAANDEERQKIATARAVLGAAQQELAAADGGGGKPHYIIQMKHMAGLDPQVLVQMESLKNLKVDSKVRVELDKLRTLDVEKLRADAEASRVELESHRAEIDRALNEVRLPEFQAKLRAQVEAARKVDRTQIDAMVAAAKQQRAAAEQMRKQMDAAMMARNEMPVLPGAFQVETDKPIKIAPGTAGANILKRTVDPVYPEEARQQHIDGSVVLQVIIDKTGHIEAMQVASSPSELLSRSAMDAVKQWTWRPYLLNGNPHAIETTVTVNFNTMNPSTAAVQANKPLRVESSKMAGNVLNKVVPVYPPSAKEAHISGAVVLHAMISEAGTVESLAVVSSPDESLSKSALQAVQQWTYKPYLLNGNPTAVDTTITVNYSFGG